jgi:hypothetical protein
MAYLTHSLGIIAPFVALTIVGFVLMRRHRTLVTCLIALGFSLVVLGHIMSIVMGYHSFDAKNDFLAATNRLTWWLPVTHWSIVLGIWIGSLSLLCHTLTKPHASA